MTENITAKPAKWHGSWYLFQRHLLDNICNGNRKYFHYLVRWMAWVVQNKRRSEVCILLRSNEEGSGKGFVAKHFGRLFGPHFMQVNNPEHVVGKFNPHLETLILLNADEALFAGDPRHRNALWGLISEEMITIEPKGYAAYKCPNYLNLIITTNSEHAVDVNDTARRIFALDVAPHQVGHPEYFDKIEAQLKDGGYEAMLRDLLHMDLSNFDVRRVVKTDALSKQKALSRKGVDAVVEDALNTGVPPCHHYRIPGYSVTMDSADRNGFDSWIAKHGDREVSRLGALRVKRKLKEEWGCTIGKASQKKDGKSVISGILWPMLPEARATFERKHGPQHWLRADVTDWVTDTLDNDGPGPQDGRGGKGGATARGAGQGSDGQGARDDLPF